MKIRTLADGTLRDAYALRHAQKSAQNRRRRLPMAIIRLISRAAERKHQNDQADRT